MQQSKIIGFQLPNKQKKQNISKHLNTVIISVSQKWSAKYCKPGDKVQKTFTDYLASEQ